MQINDSLFTHLMKMISHLFIMQIVILCRKKNYITNKNVIQILFAAFWEISGVNDIIG